jgi:3-hexulose-6-phosphate synthase
MNLSEDSKRRVKLQISLDLVNLDQALELVERTQKWVDIVEVGTPLALREGIAAITSLKTRFPALLILADYKIVDGGFYEADIAFRAGADIVTVLGVASDATITGALQAAREHGGQIMLDLLGLELNETKIVHLDGLGADYLCVHTAIDDQQSGSSPLDDLDKVNRLLKNSRLAVAGGLNETNLPRVMRYHPAIVIVGGGITRNGDPVEAAARVRKIMDKSYD